MKQIKQIKSQLVRLFLACYVIHCFCDVYFIFSPFYESLGASAAMSGWFLSIFYGAMILTRPLGGLSLERLGVKITLMGSAALCVVGGVGIALSLKNTPLLLTFRAISGAGFGIFVVAALAYQSMVIPKEARGSAFSLVTTGSMAPLATAVPLAEYLLLNGYPYVYLWSGPVLAAFCVFLGRHIEVKGEPKNEIKNAVGEQKVQSTQWGTYGELVKQRGFAALLISALCLALIDAMTLCVASLAAEVGTSASSFMAASAVSAVLVRTVGFRLMDKAPRTLTIAPSFGLMSAALFFISFCTTGYAFLFWGAVFGVGIGVGFPASMSLVGDLMPPAFHPKGTAVTLLALDLGWTITPLAFGYVSLGSVLSFRYAGALGIAVSAAAFWLLWLPIYRRQRHK